MLETVIRTNLRAVFKQSEWYDQAGSSALQGVRTRAVSLSRAALLELYTEQFRTALHIARRCQSTISTHGEIETSATKASQLCEAPLPMDSKCSTPIGHGSDTLLPCRRSTEPGRSRIPCHADILDRSTTPMASKQSNTPGFVASSIHSHVSAPISLWPCKSQKGFV